MTSKLATAVVALMIVSGCSDDDDSAPPAQPTATAPVVASATPTVAATEVPTAVATATPDEHGTEHRELRIGAVEDGGGVLDAEFDYDRAIPLFFDTCLGGSGDDCLGGVRLYSAVNPGFVALGHDHGDASVSGHGHGGEHEDSLFPLTDGTAVSLEVIAIDEGLSMRIEGATLDAPGQVVDLGEAPHFHSDSESFLSLTDDQEESDFHFSFRLTSDAPEYLPSDPLTVRFSAVDGEHEHDDEHEHQ